MRAIWTLLATWLSFWGFHPAKFHPITAPLPRIVALTFDDGPSPVYTPKILTILQNNHAHATFFVLGSEAERFPQVAREIIRQGSVIANHGYGHLNFFHAGVQRMWLDAEKTQNLLQKSGIPTVAFYRPPYGNSSPRLIEAFRVHGYTTVFWSIDTRDWAMPSTAAIIRRTLGQIQPGAIILMHDGGGNRQQTVEAVAAIVKFLRADGYRFVTLPQYVQDLHLSPPPARLPLPAAPPPQAG